jgi:hypothetical protein
MTMTMKLKVKKLLIGSSLLACLCWQTMQLGAQQITTPFTVDSALANQDERYVIQGMLEQAQGADLPVLLEKIFGDKADAAADALNGETEQLFVDVEAVAFEKASEHLDEQIEEQKTKAAKPPIIAPQKNTAPAKKAATKAATKAPAKLPTPKGNKSQTSKPTRKNSAKPMRSSFHDSPMYWRPVAFGFQLVNQQEQAPDAKPEIKLTESDKEIKAEGSNKKDFETKDAKGTRTQKAETRYIKDGTTFGVEIKNTEIIEAVSKPDGKSFRKEISMVWGADVAACPDTNGITAGSGKAKVMAKTVYTEAGETVTMTSQFDLQAKLTGHVNDNAEMKHYDLVLDAYCENSGYEEALKRNLIKEIKIKDGRYGLHYDVPGNTIEISDGKYGGKRTPAKMGKVTGRTLTPMTDAQSTLVASAIGPMVPSIWNSANEMYVAAQRNWRNYGCVEVACTVPKLTIKPGEKILISAQTVHLQDNQKINAQLNAEAYGGQVTPESQRATPSATFTFTQEGEDSSSFHAESVSKRGIGKGDVEFQLGKAKEEPAQAGAWTGIIKVERKQREEREKRSGANLAENGGYLQTTTNIQLQLTGKRDRTVDATNAYIATVSGQQQQVDYEYDKYKVDEGYCGPNAVPYKGPKEITRTSTTTINYNKETRVFLEIDGAGGNVSFSLPEQNGTTVHKYTHKSPCPDNDRANTSEAKDEDVAGPGGSFSVAFSVASAQKSIKGSKTVREDDGSTTVYSWELERH